MPRKFLVLCLFCAGLLAAAAPARASQDVVRIFDNVDIGPDESVHDAVCVFCSVHVEGKVDGDLVSIFGNVRLNGEAHHDVVSVFGNVTAAGDSSIGGDLVSIFGAVRLGDNVTVGKDTVTIFGMLHAPHSVSVGKDRVSISPWIAFGPFIVIWFAVFLIVHEVREQRRRRFFQNYPLPPRQ
jgi:predicted acyltransferase (DUF342 family)